MQNELKENKMGTMPVKKLLISMGLPMALSMLVQALYNIVDSIYVSRLAESALSAVSMAFPVQNVMMALASGTAVGINSLLSRSLGAKRYDDADRYAGTGIFLELCGFLLIMTFGLSCSELFFRVQTKNPDIIRYGRDYLFYISTFSFGLFGQILGERLLNSTGRTFYSMIVQSVGALINIILDPILIFGLLGLPRLETKGAAIATVIGQICAACLAFIFNAKVNHDIHIKIVNIIKPKLEFIKNILSVGIPSMIMMMVGSVMNFVMNQILISFSDTAVAVFGVYYKLQSFVFMPVFGLNNGMVPIVAFNYGARKRKRITDTVKYAVIYAVSLMLIGFAAFELAPQLLLRLYNASEHMLSIGVPALRITAIAFPFAGFCIVAGSVFQALGNGVYSLINSVARQIVVLLPVAFLLSLSGNLESVWFAFPIAEVMSVTLSCLFLRRIYRLKLKDLPE